MKHIRELKARWQIRFRSARRTPREVNFSFCKSLYSKRQIERLRDRLYVAWDEGWDPWTGRLPGEDEPAEQDPLTVIEAVRCYCDHKRLLGSRRQRGGWNERTYGNYLTNLKAFARLVGQTRLVSTLETKDLAAFIFQEGLREETCAMYRRQLATFVHYLMSEGHVRDLDLPRPMVMRRTIKPYLTERELEAVCRQHEALCRAKVDKKYAPKSGPNTGLARLWMSDAFRVAFYQGLRRGELLALRRGAVDLQSRRLAIGDEAFIPKGGSEDVIPITRPALSVMEQYCEGKAPTDRLFPFNSPGRLTRAFKEAASEAVPEKPDLHFHSLRRSCGYYWAERGLSPWDVKSLLRHKSLRTTEQYYVQGALRGQTERFDRAADQALEAGSGSSYRSSSTGNAEKSDSVESVGVYSG